MNGQIFVSSTNNTVISLPLSFPYREGYRYKMKVKDFQVPYYYNVLTDDVITLNEGAADIDITLDNSMITSSNIESVLQAKFTGATTSNTYTVNYDTDTGKLTISATGVNFAMTFTSIIQRMLGFATCSGAKTYTSSYPINLQRYSAVIVNYYTESLDTSTISNISSIYRYLLCVPTHNYISGDLIHYTNTDMSSYKYLLNTTVQSDSRLDIKTLNIDGTISDMPLYNNKAELLIDIVCEKNKF